MPHADFVHLRVHSAYSLSEGALRLKELAALCREHRMPAVAVTDSNNLFGALEFTQAACAAGVQPIIGCQLSLHRSGPAPVGNGAGALAPAPDQIVLLVQNETGYRNLLQLSSTAFLAGDPGQAPQVGLEDLAQHAEGLLALTGGPAGPVGRLLGEGRREAAEAALAELAELFPGRLYVEIMRHGLAEERAIEDDLIALAYAGNLPLIATNDVYFPERDMYEAHDVLLCIAEGSYLVQEDRRRLTPEHHFKSAVEMRELFADLPEAVDNTIAVARRCSFFPETVRPILPAFPTQGERSEAEELRVQAAAGLEERLEQHVFARDMDEAQREAIVAPYRERLDFELSVIEQMGFPGYFLIVADFIGWAKRNGIPVGPGRGSGAGSVVAWSLSITDLDPLRWGLLFERFLNPERVSMPDFDIDFCQERRDEVIGYVQRKYGQDRVAQIITFGKLQARAALRDVGRVLQMPYPQVDRICKLVPNNPANPVTLQQAIEGEPQLQEMQRTDESVARLLEIALKLEGLYRHASTHAAGVVIGDRPLAELIPLYRDPRSDMPVTQFNMKYVEQAGLVKFDFLGLKTLSVLQKAGALIEDGGEGFELQRIPLQDPRTYEMLGRAETVGVFQLESSGMRDVLRRLKADRFEDIIAVVALYRPGPMDNIPSYIDRKHGRELPDYLYPSLEGILKETYGIMIYQEQVMQIAQELAGYSLGAADLLRRAMGKKIKAEMDAQRQSFVEGAVARGVPLAKAEQIFDLVNKFAGYGFNKSHAAAYALVAYQTAYLKANHPVEFLAASMTFDMGNTDKLNIFRQELERLGILLLPPDVNRSGAEFTVETLADGRRAVRYALGAIKNVGTGAMAQLVAEREANGPFTGLADFVSRLDNRVVSKRQIENLACAGAFDGLNPNRRQVFQGAEGLVRHAAYAASERASQQQGLFGPEETGSGNELKLPQVDDWPMMERLRHELDAIGFYLSAHPLDAYQANLERLGIRTAASLREPGRPAGSERLKLGAIVINKQERTSRNGNRFAFVQCSDSSGVFEVVVFADLLASTRDLLDGGQPLLLTVTAELREGDEEPRLIAQEIAPLDRVAAQTSVDVVLHLVDAEALPTIRDVLARQGKGRSRVSLLVRLTEEGAEVDCDLPGRYSLPPVARQALKAVPGVILQER